jgi:hypothetical protein
MPLVGFVQRDEWLVAHQCRARIIQAAHHQREPVGALWSRGRDGPLLYHAKLLAPVRKVDVDPRADANLAPPPDLGLTIDPHHAAHYQRLGLAAVGDEIGELEQLPQTNGVPADFDLHPASVDYRFT